MKRIQLIPFILAACFLQSCASNDTPEEDGVRAVKEQQQASEVLKGGTELRQFEAPRLPRGSVKP